MKVHKNQWLLTMPYPLERLAGATSRGQTMEPEVQKPSKWLCLTKLPREKYSQPIVHKALSWGSIRKSACMLAEITIRKSQVVAKGFDGIINKGNLPVLFPFALSDGQNPVLKVHLINA